MAKNYRKQTFQKLISEEKPQNKIYISRYETKKMSLNKVPPKKRKVILVISEHELTRLEYIPEGSDLLLNDQVYLLVPSDESDDSLESKLDIGGLLEAGNLLIQNPYDISDYVVLNKASSTFALAKYLHFTTLCGILGAREVTVEQIEVKTSTGKQIFKGSLNSPHISGNINAENRVFEEIRNNIKLNSEFDGGEPNIDEAEAFLQKYQLLNDISMRSLIDQRKGENPIKKREVTLSLSEESEKNFQAISNIKVPVYAKLQTQIEQVKKEKYTFTLTIKVYF